jgi:TorA maturation chaperone TorD
MRVKCWQHIKDEYKGIDDSNPEVSAIRAVIFALGAHREAEQRDIVDHLSCFLSFVNQVEPHREEEEKLLRRYFTKCI